MPRALQHPARLVPLAFLLAIGLGTGLLMLPAARAGGGGAPFLTALFTATSAVSVTGLTVQDTPTYWSGVGQGIILALFQVGGLGIMSGATLLGLLVARRLRLSTRLLAQAETRSLALGDVVGVLRLVLRDLRRNALRAARWSLHTKITLLGTGLLLLGGTAAVLAYEWGNPATLGPRGPAGKLLGAAFHSAMTRSGGFNAFDVGEVRPETLAVSYVLMMIGGGSAGTAGGIKVTTFLVLGLVVWAEIRGEPDVAAFGRRVSRDVQRQALAVALLAVGFVGTATLVLLSVSDLALDDALFEVVSAFATVGLSTGVTADLPPAGQALLAALMFLGRVGTVTVATGLALRGRRTPYRYPEERPIVG